MDQVTSVKYESYVNGESIPNLGIAIHESAIACDSYLISERASPINLRPLKQITQADTEKTSFTIAGHTIPINLPSLKSLIGQDRYAIDQLANPDTITFLPGGLWKDDILLYGRVATVSKTKIAQKLLRRFQTAIKKHFVKVNAFYVGPQAIELLKKGKRLTPAEQSPPEFDLKLPKL